MIKHKNIGMIAALLMAASVLFLSIGYVRPSILDGFASSSEPPYVTEMDKTKVMDIQIIANEKDWADMLENAAAEEYIPVTVIINGEKIKNVGIRPKGNSSLIGIVHDESNRFSFRLKFDQYIKGQTYLGMSDFVVNNMTGDASYLKEYISYDIMTYIGVDSPLYAFANLTVNGDEWGFYLAVERYDDAFLKRTYGDTKGKLYNVKVTDDGAVGDNAPFILDVDGNLNIVAPNGEGQVFDTDNLPQFEREDTTDAEGDGNVLGRGFIMGDGMQAINEEPGGGDLKYKDDNIDSYMSIFENVVGTANDKEKALVIEALKALAEGRNLEKYFDVDQVIRYFAAHTVVVNLDSYVSMMAQNYFLSENNGKISILPWDYNFAFDAFRSANATVNFPIDTPVNSVSLEDRPLLNMIFKNEEYLAKYHQYLQEIVTGYFADGKFASKITEVDARINKYVKNDPSSFYTYEEYTNAVAALITLGELRAESIQGQLDGTVPSTTDAQKADLSALISTDTVDMSVLGNSGMGGAALGGDDGMIKENLQAGAIPQGVELPAAPSIPSTSNSNAWIELGGYVTLLLGGLLFVISFKRRKIAKMQ